MLASKLPGSHCKRVLEVELGLWDKGCSREARGSLLLVGEARFFSIRGLPPLWPFVEDSAAATRRKDTVRAVNKLVYHRFVKLRDPVGCFPDPKPLESTLPLKKLVVQAFRGSPPPPPQLLQHRLQPCQQGLGSLQGPQANN